MAWRDRDHPGLRVVLAAEPLEVGRDGVGGELTLVVRRPAGRHAGEAAERAGLVDDDVGAVGAHHGLPRLEDGGQADDVGARPAPAGEGLHGRVEPLAEEVLQAAGPRVVAVGEGGAVVRGGQGGEHLGRDAGGVVAGEGALGGRGQRGHRGSRGGTVGGRVRRRSDHGRPAAVMHRRARWWSRCARGRRGGGPRSPAGG